MKHTVEKNILTLERTLNAPRQKVWDAFTKPEQFIKWWGPNGWTAEVKEFNFSEGGSNHYGMKCEDPAQTDWYGKYSWGNMVFSAIQPIEQFSYTDYFVDEHKTILEGMPATVTTLKFIEDQGKTTLVSTTTFDSEEAVKMVLDMGMIQGITETWDKLEAFVA